MIETLAGMRHAAFEERYRGRGVLFAPGGARTYAPLFSWATLNRILEVPANVLEHTVLIREGQKLDRKYYVSPKTQKLVPGSVRKALSEGCTLVVSRAGAVSDAIQEMNDALCNDLGVNVWTNVYVSWSTNKGFLTHWDTHDVFILQTEGEKDWTVFQPQREHGLQVDIENRELGTTEGMQPAWEGRLSAGDVLYIPRGWWHHAKATGVGSIHLTLGMECVSGIQAIEYLAQEARKAAVFRRDLPSLNGADPDEAAARFEAELAQFFAKHLPGVTRRTWEDYFGRLPVRSRHHLPVALDAEQLRGSNIRVQFAGLAPYIPIAMLPEHFTITMGGRRWKFAIAAYPVVQRLLGGDIFSIEDLAAQCGPDMDHDTCRKFVFELLNEGLINIVDEAPPVE